MTYLYKKLGDLPADLQELVVKGPSKLPPDSYIVKAKTPWQDLFWSIFLYFFGAVLLFLFVFIVIQPESDKLASLVFLVPAFVCLWIAYKKMRKWRDNKTYLLFTSAYLIERINKGVSVISWKEIRSAEIGLPKKSLLKKQIPSITVKTEKGDLYIICGYPTGLIDEPYNVIWHNLLPGVMLFSSQPTFYKESEYAIKKKIEEYMERFGRR